MKRVGITPCFLYPDITRKVFGPKTLIYAEMNMVDYVSDHNAIPELILDIPDKVLEESVKALDGIIFAGGSDVCPETYNKPYLDKEKWPGDIFRDKFEAKVFKLALKYKIPVFGICRGAQLINGLMGGDLYQDLEIQTQTKVAHRHATKYDTILHEIEFAQDGILASLYKNETNLNINTVHHQGLKTLAPGLVPEAYSPSDKLIEAYSHKDMQDHFILAVQWHPEFSKTLEDKVINYSPLMEYFLKAL